MQPAISVKNLSKCYKLGSIGRHTLVDEVTYWWHRVRGRDPRHHFGKIGHSPTEARRVAAEKSGVDHFRALDDVSFDVQQGEAVGIIGKNGAGKSTLLKILSRITEPTSGEVFLNGRVGSLLEVGTGFHLELTGRENIYMNGAILGMNKEYIKRKFDEIIAFSGIEQFIDTPVKRYSSGMYVRLAFAVAAHLEPEIIVIDEVLAVGDAEFQKKCLGKMEDVAKQGRTVLFVSHNMAAIATLCRKTLLFDTGKLISQGLTSEIILSYYDLISRNDAASESQRKEYGDEYCAFVGASIVNDNDKPIVESTLGDAVAIAMTYDILKQTRDRMVPNFHLKTADGQSVCCVSPPAVNPMAPGRYRAVCRIPQHFLNEGTYAVGIAVTSYHGDSSRATVNFYVKNHLMLNVIDKKEKNEWNYGFAKRVPGVVRPRWDWEITRKQ